MKKRVIVSFPGGKKVNASVSRHIVQTDQPEVAGGDGTAPGPFDLFLSSLATCAGYYALDFCQNRDISTEGLSVELVCEKNEEKKLYSQMRFELTLPKGFPEKYEKAIIRAMDLCSVKRHMVDAPEFSIAVV